MLSSHQIYEDSKENINANLHGKLNIQHSHTRLKSQSLKNFKDSTNINQIKKIASDSSCDEKFAFKKDILLKKETVENEENHSDVSDIEEMHIYEEQEDNYEDIISKEDRLNQSDIDYFFLACSNSTFNYCEEPEDRLPSPIYIFEELTDSSDMNDSGVDSKLYEDTALIPIEEPLEISI
ncbi:uncharacterized protein LOC129224314 [Uloborus diversus]|uniref:uncharacterized protein LOC129224314 n=1 Tax=Uloborus diversus TaxID=327109 RepID=UPI00240A7249|nr:uncharacterized protein LOC129224314 [Uloborus diversus]